MTKLMQVMVLQAEFKVAYHWNWHAGLSKVQWGGGEEKEKI